jgi:pseudaminic acid biosynthesis-associated methylase
MNKQEAFWAGSSGDEYTTRSRGPAIIAANTALFARALSRAHGLASCIEFGANIGLSLQALKTLYPEQEQHAVEINESAAAELAQHIPDKNIVRSSFLSYQPNRVFDLVLAKTILVTVHPDELPKIYKTLHQATGRYLLLIEFYNPTPVDIVYRGQTGVLFKRDFCGEMLDAYSDLTLLDYGFSYRRDRQLWPAGYDLNWFLLEKH